MFPEALGYDAQLDNNPPFEILLSQNMYTEYAKLDGKYSPICGLYFTHVQLSLFLFWIKNIYHFFQSGPILKMLTKYEY